MRSSRAVVAYGTFAYGETASPAHFRRRFGRESRIIAVHSQHLPCPRVFSFSFCMGVDECGLASDITLVSVTVVSQRPSASVFVSSLPSSFDGSSRSFYPPGGLPAPFRSAHGAAQPVLVGGASRDWEVRKADHPRPQQQRLSGGPAVARVWHFELPDVTEREQQRSHLRRGVCRYSLLSHLSAALSR